MPTMPYPDKNGKWASPWDVFVGDPHLNYYGAYSPVIVKTINNYWAKNGVTGYTVKDLSGSSVEDLYAEIDVGNPVIVWATCSMLPSKPGRSWILQNGTTFNWIAGEHCLVLIGYDTEKNSVVLSDPYDARGTVEYPRETFEKRFTELHKQALVIHKQG